MIKLYRAVSQLEKDDFDTKGLLRIGENTLEAKQFFKSKEAVEQFVKSAILQKYSPPYAYLFTISVDKEHFNNIVYSNMELDGYDAVSIDEDSLPAFNNCIKFVNQAAL